MARSETTDDWKLLQIGIDFNNGIHPAYYANIDRNWRMYNSDQWFGVEANGLPTPVFNMFKPIINHFIAYILSQDTAIQYVTDGMDTDVSDVMKLVTSHVQDLWEQWKMDSKRRMLLYDGALSGDFSMYVRWDKDAQTGLRMGVDPDTNQDVPLMGEICNEIVDGVNVFFGNPNDSRVNDGMRPVQPYIIIAFREMTAKLKAEAKANKRPQDEIDAIVGDTDNTNQAGDRGKTELSSSNPETAKTTCIIKLWPENGRIMARKSTKHVTIRNTWNLDMTIYPLSYGSWESVKNSYHGNSIGTGLVPNQLFINKLFAMAMISTMNLAFPRVAFDKNKISEWVNSVGAALPVNGSVEGIVKVLNGAEIGTSVISLIDSVIKYTKDCAGAYDAAMGNVTPDNTSAIVAVQQAASIPLENIRQGLYQFVEDLAYIWLDMMIANYGERPVKGEDGEYRTIDFSSLRNKKIRVKVEIGSSSFWSQIAAQKTMDNLLSAERITFLQYLERAQDGTIPDIQGLIDDEKAKLAQAAAVPQGAGDMSANYQMPPAMPEQINPAGIA